MQAIAANSRDDEAAGQRMQVALGHAQEVSSPLWHPAEPSIPSAPDKQGRYRLVTLNGTAHRGKNSDLVITQLLLLDPSGSVVSDMKVVSGGWGRGALPGLNPDTYRGDFSQRPLVAEYPLNWDNMRESRPDRPSFGYSDGTPGFSVAIDNAANMAELGGAGRDAFRIHPGGQRMSAYGREPQSEGCLKILNDREARQFWKKLMSLSPEERPLSLEIVNRHYIGRPIEPSRGMPQLAAVEGMLRPPAIDRRTDNWAPLR
jgi:hypothetical protein